MAEIRAILRARGRGGAEWELGDSCTPADLVERLTALGIVPDADEPVAIGMVSRMRAARSRCRREHRRAASRRSTSSSRRGESSTRHSEATPTRSGYEQAEADFATRGRRSARRSSPSSTASRSRPGTPRTRRSASSSSEARRFRRPAAVAATARSSRRAPARRRIAARRWSSLMRARCRGRSSSGSDSRPVSRIDRLLDVFASWLRVRRPARAGLSPCIWSSRTGSSRWR